MIDILTHGEKWQPDHIFLIRTRLQKIADFLKTPGEMSVLLTNDEEIRALNYQYRQKDYPTNILSFETSALNVLGDLVLSFETLETESLTQNKDFENHLTHLLIHGLLHLTGSDHIIESEAEKMENLEIEIMKNLFNLPNPYGEQK